MLANKSADATHHFQPFQPIAELVEKVDQPNQPQMVNSQLNTKKLNQPNQPKTVDASRTRPYNCSNRSIYTLLNTNCI